MLTFISHNEAETEAFAQSLRSQHYSSNYIDEIRYCNGIGMNIAETVRDSLSQKYGSVERYLRNELISDEQIRQLRNQFLESIPTKSFEDIK